MEKLLIKGGISLNGEVTISGSKNAAVAIIAATVLCEGTCRIENLPDIKDVAVMSDILYSLGAVVRMLNKSTLEIDCTHMSSTKPPFELVKKVRASYYMLGALIGRYKKAQVATPGGCDFGVRPIDQHIKGFESLGVNINIEHGIIDARADSLVGAQIYMDSVSVGATVNIILAAVKAEGVTVIENAAKEPHIVDLANFLNSMGANIKGAGTDIIKISGVSTLHGGEYSIIPDQIEAGTYMVAAAATNGRIFIKNVIPKHLESITAKLNEMNVIVEENDDTVLVYRDKPLGRVNVKTLPYPGFPTDMNPQIAVLLCLAEGTSVLTEGVWESRFRYIEELKSMGANITVDGKIAIIEGVDSLSGAPVKACDLRAGAAMVIAGLAARGYTEIGDVNHIYRGYENMVEKLRILGAEISSVDLQDKRQFEKAQ